MSNTDIVPTNAPMSEMQLRTLERLVERDFADLRNSVITAIRTRTSERTEALNAAIVERAKAAEAEVDVIVQRLKVITEEARAKYQEVYDDIVVEHPDDATGPFITFGTRVTNLGSAGFERDYIQAKYVAGKEDVEIEKILAASSRLADAATAILSRMERKAQRDVMMQGIGASDAAGIISSLPDADDILAMVDAEITKTRPQDIETVQGLLEQVSLTVGE